MSQWGYTHDKGGYFFHQREEEEAAAALQHWCATTRLNQARAWASRFLSDRTSLHDRGVGVAKQHLRSLLDALDMRR